MPRLPVLFAFFLATTASALTFTTHFPATAASAQLVTAGANVVYAGAGRMLYRSDDGGATFALRSTTIGTGVVVDPTNPDIVYTFELGSVRRSMDGGATWTVIVNGLPTFLVPRKIVISAQHPSTLFLANDCASRLSADGGVFRSDDRGDTWSGTPGGTCVTDAAFDALADKLYPLIRDTFYGSYQPVLLPKHQIVTSARNPQVRYGIAYDAPNGYVTSTLIVVASFDGGATWERVPLTGVDPAPSAYELALALDGDSGRLFLATSSGLYVSPNGGPYWVPVAAAPRVRTTDVAMEGSFLYINTARGMFRAPLGSLDAFTPLGALPDAPAALLALAADPNTGVLYASGRGAWRSADAGQHWEWIAGENDAPRRSIAVDDAGDVYAFADDPLTPAMFRYRAGAWESYATTLPRDVTQQLFVSPGRRGVLVTLNGGALFKSADGGHVWQRLTLDGIVAAVAFDPNRVDALYAGTSNGIFGSLDGGATWTRLDAEATTAIAVAPSRPATLYRFAGGRLLRSDDGGVTWRQLVAPITGRLMVDPLNEHSVWIAAAQALWHSADAGATWSDETGNLAPTIQDLLIDRDGKHLHVLDGGVWDAVLRTERRRAVVPTAH